MLWLLLGSIAVSVVVLARIRREGLARVARWNGLVRAPADLRPGPALLQVRVAAELDTFVDMGMSKETGEGASASPTIETRTVRLCASDGTELMLSAGQQLQIRAIPGARRRLIESITTESSIEHRYSFELAGGKEFWLLAELSPAAEQAVFRSAAPRELRPIHGILLAGMRLVPEYRFGAGAAAGLFGGALVGGMMGAMVAAFVGEFIETLSTNAVVLWCCAFSTLLGALFGEGVSIPEDAVR